MDLLCNAAGNTVHAAAAPPNEKTSMHGAFLHSFSESSDPPGSIRQERDGYEEAEGF